MMDHLGGYAVGVAFWIFLTAVSVVGIVADLKKRQLQLAPLRAALEHGQQLDPQTLERLLARESETPLNPVYLRIGGIVTMAAGIGIALVSVILTPLIPIVRYPGVALGVLAVCVGAGVLLSARVLERSQRPASEHGPVA